MLYAVIYGSALLAYCVIDGAWIALMYTRLYQPALAGLLSPAPRIMPALIFYLLYPIGILVFAVLPALQSSSPLSALGLGALFGALAYATYGLTNQATLRNWQPHLTVSDIAWGASVTGASATVSFYASRAIGAAYGLL